MALVLAAGLTHQFRQPARIGLRVTTVVLVLWGGALFVRSVTRGTAQYGGLTRGARIVGSGEIGLSCGVREVRASGSSPMPRIASPGPMTTRWCLPASSPAQGFCC